VTTPLTQRQHRVLQAIERFIEDEGYTPSVREFGTAIDLAPATVQQHIQALDRKGYLQRSGESHGIQLLKNGLSTGVLNIPIVGEIAAGTPIEAYEARFDTIAIPSELSPRSTAYALRVRGDSMIEDHICDGDIVIVEPAATVNDGEISVAMLNDDSVTLKRVYREGKRVRLQPANSTMKPIYSSDVRLQGRVISIMRQT
jgi:repressor LexA